jgi:hypothetical protein
MCIRPAALGKLRGPLRAKILDHLISRPQDV